MFCPKLWNKLKTNSESNATTDSKFSGFDIAKMIKNYKN